MKYGVDTNYYAIRVFDEEALDEATDKWVDKVDDHGRVTRTLALDLLTHSYVAGWIIKDAAGREVGFQAD